MQDILAHFKANRENHLKQLTDFLAIPRISTGTEHKAGIARAAAFVENQLKEIGLSNVRQYPTKGHPVVYGEWLGAKGAPTALIYGHYDVQPPEPLELWETPPFEATIRDNKILARGAADDK